jgi:hypothetical protein
MKIKPTPFITLFLISLSALANEETGSSKEQAYIAVGQAKTRKTIIALQHHLSRVFYQELGLVDFPVQV